MSTLKIPKRRKRVVEAPVTQTPIIKKTNDSKEQVIQLDDEYNEPMTPIEDLFIKKKRRIERQKTDNLLETLFDSLQKDVDEKERNGEYGIEMPKVDDSDQIDIHLADFDDHFLLFCEMDSDSEDQQDENFMKETAKLYLDEDAQENLDQALEDSRKVEVVDSGNIWQQDFFYTGIKNIRQPSLISRDLTLGQREIHISELSATPEGRAYLLQTGCIKDWVRSGWKCPSYIYQWLFEVVGLELNTITAKNALHTLLDLWSIPDSPEEQLEKAIELTTFKDILLAYDAIPSRLDYFDAPSPVEGTINRKARPLSQLGWLIKAFSLSIDLFRSVYTTTEIRYTIRILLLLSIDSTGYLMIQDIQTAIDHGLAALDPTSWQTDLRTMANDVADIVSSGKSQMHLLDAIKTIHPRARAFRRQIGLTCLERGLERDSPGSVDYISTDQSIIQQIAQIYRHPESFFQKTKHIDYEECYIRVAFLDAAIGTDTEDIKKDKDTVLEIADHLRDISLQMGSRLGVIKKTLANEMIQRVWSRISYAAGRKSNFEL